MAAINPKLTVNLGMNAAGLHKGVGQAKQDLQGLGKAASQSDKHVSSLKKNLGGIWRITGGILLFNVIRHITHSIRDLIGTTMDFETQMRNVNSVAQLSEQEFKQLNEAVLDLALDPRVKDGPAELAKGLYEVVSAGYSTADGLKIMEQAAFAATAGMTTTETAADVIISTLGAYGLSAEHAGEVTDQLFQIVNISKYTFEDLASAMDSVTPTAAALGVGINDIGAAMAVMASKGVDADTATVQLNGIMTALLKPTDAMTEIIHGLGYASGSAMIKTEGFTKTMQLLYGTIGDNEDLAAAAFGDVRALRGYMNLTNDGAVALEENLVKMGEATDGVGATQKALNEQMKATSFQLAVLRKNIQILAIKGYGLLMPYFNRAITGVNNFVAKSIKAFNKYRGMGIDIFSSFKLGVHEVLKDTFSLNTANSFLHFVDAMETLVHGLEDAFKGMWSVIQPILEFLGKHMDYVTPAIIGAVAALVLLKLALIAVAVVGAIVEIVLSPIFLLILALMAVGALFAVAWTKDWFDIRDKTSTAIEFIVDLFHWVMKEIQPLIDGIVALGTYWKKIVTHSIEPGNLEGVPGWLKPIALVTGRVVKSIRVFIVTWKKLGALAAFRTLPKQIAALGRALAKVADQAGLHEFAKGLEDAYYRIGKIVGNIVNIVHSAATGDWDAVFRNILRLAGNIGGLLAAVIQMIGGLIEDASRNIPWEKIFKGIWEGIKAADAKINLAMQRLGAFLWEAFLAGMQSIWDNQIVPFLQAVGKGIIDGIKWYWNGVYDAGYLLIDALWKGMSSLWNSLVSWFDSAVGAIATAAESIWSSMYDAGWDIVDGFWQGFSSLWNSFMDWLGTAWDEIPGGIKKVLGIASPSKVFAEVGMNAMLGLQQGIQQGLPNVQTSVAVVGSATVKSAQTSMASADSFIGQSTTSPRSYNFGDINVTSTASDPVQVAREVSKVLLAEITRVEAGAA